MTDKRFIIDDNYQWIDTETDTALGCELIFNLLNELHEENTHLKKQLNCITKSLQNELNNYRWK